MIPRPYDTHFFVAMADVVCAEMPNTQYRGLLFGLLTNPASIAPYRDLVCTQECFFDGMSPNSGHIG